MKTTTKVIWVTMLSLLISGRTFDTKALTKQEVSHNQSFSIARKMDKVTIINSPVIEHGNTPWLLILGVSGVSSLCAFGIWTITSRLGKNYINGNKNNPSDYEFVKINENDKNQSN